MLKQQIQLDLPSILDCLKTGTSDNHRQIEKVPAMKRMFAPDYSLDEYKSCLQRFYGFYASVEPILFSQLPADLKPVFEGRVKLELLRADLKNLGMTDAEIRALPTWEAKDYVNNLEECLGVWYVLEGSTLGGQVISQHITKHFGDSAAAFLHFHQGYQQATRQHWVDFCELIKDRIPSGEVRKVTQAVTAARLTFNYLSDWLSA